MILSKADSQSSYQVTFKPNCSLSSLGKQRVVLLMTVIPCCIAVGFSFIGAWLVLPFVGLEIFALGYAFYYINSHDSDYESISIDGDSLKIQRCVGQVLSKYELNPYWASVVRHELPNGTVRLGLRSQGKEVEVGRYLTTEQREELAVQLRKRTGAYFIN